MIDRIFVDYSIEKLRQASSRVDACLEKLNEQQVWARGGDNENTVGNLALHLCGNVRQWIVSGIGGASYARDRDGEFTATGGVSISELRGLLRNTVEEGVGVIRAQTAESLARRIEVQKYDVTVLEAIYHVVEHFAGHAGQIIFVTKMMTGEDLGFYGHLEHRSHEERTP